MAQLPKPADPTLEAVKTELEIRLNDGPRSHLGASLIGDPCTRKLWYSFRWSAWPTFYADTLTRFADGHASEAIMADRLKMVEALELHTETADGHQFRFTDHGGHFAGSADGLIRGLLQAPATPHVWEHKCCNEKKTAQLDKLKAEHGEKNALAHWDAVYYAQAQVYMHYFQMTRHYLTCATPGTRDVTSVRTDYNADHAQSFIQKAAGVIASDTPPTRLTERKDDYRCKWCTYKEQCHYDAFVGENCRTCKDSKPVDSGWWCNRHKKTLDTQTQRMGCGDWQAIEGLSSLDRSAAA